MGRPSKLTEKQWTEIKRRVLAGEKPADLAREFKVSKAAVSNRVSKRIETVKTVANQLVNANRALEDLSDSEQSMARELAADLQAMSGHMGKAGKYAAASSHRLAALAHQQLDKVDDINPLESADVLRAHSVLTKLANDSSVIPSAILNAASNREVLKAAREEGESPRPVKVLVQVEDAGVPEPET